MPPPAKVIALFPMPEDRARFLTWVDTELKPGVDYILAHRKVAGARCPNGDIQIKRSCETCGAKATLSKAGAERVCIHLGLVPQFARDRETWEMLGGRAGMLCYVCTLHRGSGGGPIMGEGRGARLIEQDGGDANMAIKMGGKSAQVDATLRAAGLSERFTQDVGEGEPVVRVEGRQPAAHGAPAAPTRVAPPSVPDGPTTSQEPVRAVQAGEGPSTPTAGSAGAAGPAVARREGTPGLVTLPPLTHPVEFTLPNGQVVKGQCTAGVTAETVSALIARTSAGAAFQAKAAAWLKDLELPALRYLNEEQGKGLLAFLNEPEEAPRVPRRMNGGEPDWPAAHAELVRVATSLSTPTLEERAAGVEVRPLSVAQIEGLAAAVYRVDRIEQLTPRQVCTVAAEIETMGLKDRPALWIALGQAGVPA